MIMPSVFVLFSVVLSVFFGIIFFYEDSENV